MFRQTFVAGPEESRRPWAFSVSLLTQLLLVSLAVLLPLLSRPLLPILERSWVLLEPPPLPRAETPTPPEPTTAPPPQVFTNSFAQPQEIPDRVAMIVDEPSRPIVGPSVLDSLSSSGGPTLPGYLIGDGNLVVRPPPPPPQAEPPAPEPTGPTRVGGDVQAAKIVQRVQPIYPPLARQARISGTVELEAIIAADGTVESVKPVGGHPLLIREAMRAVSQWRYRPTLLNGAAVPVVTRVKVVFRLGG